MVWPFTSTIHAKAQIDAHLGLRDRALALELPDQNDLKKGSDAALRPDDLAILRSDIHGITTGIKERRWTATNVLCAFVRSARRAQLRTNCITEVNLQQSLVRAGELDQHFAQTGELVGPLHGVPISIKEMLPIRGTPLSLGFTSWLSRSNSSRSASVVLLAEHLGAVPFVKTNIPQTMLAFECNNPVFGRTLNPYSPHHTSGGSSGGESALIASDGSAAGVGTDIGGSLRIPAGYTGIYSLKPSAKTWPLEGAVDYGRGFEGIEVVSGPMCRSAQDLQTMHSAVVEATVPPLVDDEEAWYERAAEHEALLQKVGLACSPVHAFNPAWYDPLKVAEKRGAPLRIGYALTDGFVKTSPACYRAVAESVAALRAKHPESQIELVRVPASALEALEALELFVSMTSAEGYKMLTHPHIGKDKMDSSLFLPVLLANVPSFVRRIIWFVARFVLRDWMLARVVLAAGRKSARKYFEVIEQRSRYRDQWNQRIWGEYRLDALVVPVQASPAVSHGAAANLSMLAASTALYNIIDSAVAVLPVTRVDATRDDHRSPPTDWAQDHELTKCSRLVSFELYSKGVYDARKMQGLPVGVQVVTRAHQEEKAIGIMRLIDDALPPLEKRGGGWRDQLSHQAKRVEPGFGPGVHTSRLYAQ